MSRPSVHIPSPPKTAVNYSSVKTDEYNSDKVHQPRFVDEPEYRMDHKRRGVALIISNKYFDAHLELGIRDGTDKDAASLEQTFRKLDFHVKMIHNQTANNIRYIMNQWAQTDHSEADCFVCVIMSHGEEGIIYGTDQAIEIDLLIKPFKLNRTLMGKPKLFFIQACRGNKVMEGVDTDPFNEEPTNISKIPMEADFLFAYSTVPGHFSWRNGNTGSWFIQSLCSKFNKFGQTLELMQILTRVNRQVAFYYESNTIDPSMHKKRQIPAILSMLTKEVFFKSKKINKLESSF